MEKQRFEQSIRVQPWFKDHCFQGRVVLPAVETMQLLAEQVAETYTACTAQSMHDAVFAKFLVLPQAGEKVDVVVELTEPAAKTVHAKLLTRVKLKAMTRMIEHGSVGFSTDTNAPDPGSPMTLPGNHFKEVDSRHIYSRLVPFGPSYQTLTGTLRLGSGWALGELQAPDFPLSRERRHRLGSPFPLDGALHAACVLGQQSVDYIPFPVGFAQRIIYRPTQPGQRYTTTIHQVQSHGEELLFDIHIMDEEQKVYEAIHSVRMRDVSSSLAIKK
ncbi:polyketide synthase dehydratase domain-containing protein [Desulfogranum japonicum]|uniref:polyketide synthase dehydratase domain-containing protein n=1 Tax=Desulfogranum japonicum TaxID=231447 RepID=UPI0006855691|nr:polyketide synthase dehydratase domain-containing protein [Desulfogranum japonicum]